MGLFEKAGRRFERFKQEATDAAKDQAEFECEACGERLFTAHDTCPECGAEAVVPIESTEAETTDEVSEDGEPGDGATNGEGGADGVE